MRFKTLAIAVLLFGLNSALSAIRTEEWGTFIRTGDMSVDRYDHRATRLMDGTVLITGGGHANGRALSTAEIYDPATGTFTRTADLNTARRSHSATLLSDGTVLIAGGQGLSSEPLSSAELYDPSTGQFLPMSNMVTAQFMHTATLLADGQVLIAGGQTHFPPITGAGAEIYDPTTGLFTSTGAYPNPYTMYPKAWGPVWPKATLLSDGKVLITGNNPAELYDPMTGAFSVSARMASLDYQYGMYWHSSTLLPDGKVLIAGGTDDFADLATAELYDAATDTFTPTGSMTTSRSLHTATMLPDGMVLIAGGDTWIVHNGGGHFGGSLSSAELYEPSSGTFIPTSSMSRARSGHAATLLTDGTVLITGGISYAEFQFNTQPFRPGYSATAELFVPYRPR